jgi:hypothetical protein
MRCSAGRGASCFSEVFWLDGNGGGVGGRRQGGRTRKPNGACARGLEEIEWVPAVGCSQVWPGEIEGGTL